MSDMSAISLVVLMYIKRLLGNTYSERMGIASTRHIYRGRADSL